MWVETGDWEGGHGYLVAGASTHVWEIDSIVAASKAISSHYTQSLLAHPQTNCLVSREGDACSYSNGGSW